MFIKYIRLLAITSLFFVFLSTLTVVNADSLALTIATHDFTSDWHPIRADSYPARHVTRLTTERLLEKACLGEDKKPIGSAYGMDGGFKKICLADLVTISRTNAFINLRAIDQSRCPGLSEQDVEFTLKQINQDMTNDYRYFKLEVKGTRLFVNNSSNVSPRLIRQASSFPILRKSANPALAKRRFEAGSEGDYNELTQGRYEIESLKADIVNLQLREELNIQSQTNITLIHLKSFYKNSDLLNNIEGRQRVDVILDLPAHIRVNKDNYKPHRSSELNNVSYVAFNFNTTNSELLHLYNNKKFRQLFAASIWATDVMREKLDIDVNLEKPEGYFYGESFESGYRTKTPTPRNKAEIQPEIQRFLENNIKSVINVTFLVPPNISHFFTENQISEFFRELTEIWQKTEENTSQQTNNNNSIFDRLFDIIETPQPTQGKGLEFVPLLGGTPAQYKKISPKG
ncbi:secreted protein [Beggiatoa sp. PS]|nr:secreted protein [Beggiatoa sp. PS]